MTTQFVLHHAGGGGRQIISSGRGDNQAVKLVHVQAGGLQRQRGRLRRQIRGAHVVGDEKTGLAADTVFDERWFDADIESLHQFFIGESLGAGGMAVTSNADAKWCVVHDGPESLGRRMA